MVYKKIFKSEFSKNVAALTSSSIVAQAINFLFSVILARIYLPDDFGTLSVFIAIAGFITVVSAGKFDVAIVAASDRDDARKLFSLSFYVLLFVSMFMALAISVIYFFDLKIYKDEEVHAWFYYLIPCVIFLTGTQILWMWSVREKQFKKISFIRIAEAAANGIFCLLFAGMAAKGLLFGTLLSQFISFFLLAIIFYSNYRLPDFQFSREKLRHTFSKYIEFPKINIMQGFLDMFQIGALVLLLAKFYEPAVAGYYSLCMRVLQLPMRLIILPWANVFFAEASEVYRNKKSLNVLVKKSIRRTSLILLPIPLILIFFGPQIFSIVFGPKWYQAGEYARILSVWIYFDLIRSPISQIASILGKQKQILILSFINSAIFLAIVLIGGFWQWSVFNTLWAVSISQALMMVLIILLILQITNRHSKQNEISDSTI